ncbi:hypothetical protein GCM10023085_09890 [Actinomadura viridis]
MRSAATAASATAACNRIRPGTVSSQWPRANVASRLPGRVTDMLPARDRTADAAPGAPVPAGDPDGAVPDGGSGGTPGAGGLPGAGAGGGTAPAGGAGVGVGVDPDRLMSAHLPAPLPRGRG